MKKTFSKIVLLLSIAITAATGCKKSEPSLEQPSDVLDLPTATAAAAATCAAQGWASQGGGTTGGGTVAATNVSNYNDLKAAIENANVKVVQVSGTITIPSGGRISFQDQSGKTIYGTSGAKLVSLDQTQANSGILYIKRCTNIIIRNLIFEGPGAYDADGWDNCTIDNSSRVWVDHCEFRDGMDGNLDVKTAATNITISWCKFTYLKAPRAGGPGGSNDHRFSNLIGSSDGATGDRGFLNITFARCWWASGCRERMPRVRFGKVHILNSFFNSSVANYCVGAGFEANLLIEGSAFEGVANPINLMSNNSTAVQSKNNSFTSTSGTTAGNGKTAFTPPYSYTPIAASSVKASVTGSGGAGATVGGNVCSSF